MLDQTRLQRNPLLVASGWDPARHGRLKARLARIGPRFPPQVPPEAIFPAAWEIIDSLDGLCIKNQCPELGVGESCHAIEFDFFNYDASVLPELQAMGDDLGRPVLFLGIGYDIAGDWLVDEAGILYFRNKLTTWQFPFSWDIYSFLERDIYGHTALDGRDIFASSHPQKRPETM